MVHVFAILSMDSLASRGVEWWARENFAPGPSVGRLIPSQQVKARLSDWCASFWRLWLRVARRVRAPGPRMSGNGPSLGVAGTGGSWSTRSRRWSSGGPVKPTARLRPPWPVGRCGCTCMIYRLPPALMSCGRPVAGRCLGGGACPPATGGGCREAGLRDDPPRIGPRSMAGMAETRPSTNCAYYSAEPHGAAWIDGHPSRCLLLPPD